VVDDDASICRALGRQLQILGYDVLVFQSAQEMLASGLPTANACLLVDVYMPEMCGIDLCQRLAASGRHLPAILMSAHDDDATRRSIRQAEPSACLFKPFDEKTLLRAIGKALHDVTKLPH
jgi:FixJ family two-component response regulator